MRYLWPEATFDSPSRESRKLSLLCMSHPISLDVIDTPYLA